MSKELYDLIDFVDENKDKDISVRKYKISELPEHQELLNDEAKSTLSEDEQKELTSFLTKILDMTDGERCSAIFKYMEDNNFAELLLKCNEPVREYLLDHSTKRFKCELRKEMEDLLKRK